jgi:hypothetical protein
MSSIVSVSIGLAFLYLLLSLICSAINEVVAWAIGLRARTLLSGIQEMVGADLAGKLYSHPLVPGDGRSNLPAYLPATTFSRAIVDVLAGSPGKITTLGDLHTAIGDGKNASLRALLDESVKDLGEARKQIEGWFDDSMTRVAAKYKARAHLITFIVATVLVAGMNADTLTVARALVRDPVLRDAVAESAKVYLAEAETALPGTKTATATVEKIAELTSRIDALDLPIGWDREPIIRTAWARLAKFFGLAFTVFAVSLGAPFWFDVLAKMGVNVRSSGRPPKEANEDWSER